MTVILKTEGLNKVYRLGAIGRSRLIPALNNVNINVESERPVVISLVGESGSGKTMLVLAWMGLLPPGARVGGEVFLSASDGQRKTLANLSEPEWREVRGREIAMIFQEPMTSLNPVLRIGTQIEEAIWAHEPGLHRSVVARRMIAALEHAAVPEPDSRAY